MSLATRCPACSTVFRVVRDQLKVSEGWVRCGRCSEVFNAGERLFELESAVAPSGASQPPAPAPAPPPPVVTGLPAGVPTHPVPPEPAAETTVMSRPSWALAGEAATAAEVPDLAGVDTPLDTPQRPSGDSWWMEPLPEQAGGTAPSPGVQAPIEAPQEPAAQDTEAVARADAGAASPEVAVNARGDTVEPALDAAPATPQSAATDLDLRADPAAVQSQPMPGFVLRAERAARWRHPLWRSGLALLCLLLAATLAGQMALHYRDDVAARWPASKPWLQQACQWLGCRVEPPRHIDSVAVDSSGLVRVEGSDRYRLTLVVQNRSALPVRMPAIELALTDPQGRTMARRVLSAADLGQAVDSLPPRGELALQAMLELGERRVAGYTVELFYP